MSRPEHFFTALAGVPVHYDRFAPADYGTKGRPYKFHVTEDFESKLTACFSELWSLCPHGRAEVVASAGTYVEKPGMHGKGRAFDLDAIFWPNKQFVTLNYPADARFYLGVEAVIRRHFGTVLNYLYNVDHRDHLHIDDGLDVGFDSTKASRVLFVQAALVHVVGVPTRIDRVFGPQTEAALEEGLSILRINGRITDKGTWLLFLERVAKRAFEPEPDPSRKNPLELLHHVYDVINGELEGNPARKRVEVALNAFSNHDATQQWLKQFR